MESEPFNQKTGVASGAKSNVLCASFVLLVALAIRLYHLGEMPIDRIPDSYHRWLIAQLTMAHGWAYTDFKPIPNNTVVWLPLFQYMIAIVMYAIGNSSIIVSRITSLVFGSLTCLVVYQVCMKLYQKRWFALVGGMLIAFQPWHVDFSILGTAESLSSFLVVLATYFFVSNKPRRFGVLSFLAALCTYEAWVVVFAELVLGIVKNGWKSSRALCASVPLPLAVIGWSAWSYISTGNPTTWMTSTLYAMYPLGWKIHLANPSVLLFYTNNLLVMTFFIFFVGFVFGLLKGGKVQAITVTMLVAVVVYSLAHYVGLDFGDQARVVLVLPLIASVAPSAFPKFSGTKLRRILIVFMLLLIIVIPYFSQIWIFPRKAYIVMPEYRAGVALGQLYTEGRILSDSPTIMYASKVKPSQFTTYERVRWFLENNNETQLISWLKSNDVKYLVWEKTNTTLGPQIFPSLSKATQQTIGGATFTPVYEDSLRTGHWEHSPEYYIPDVFIYEIDYS